MANTICLSKTCDPVRDLEILAGEAACIRHWGGAELARQAAQDPRIWEYAMALRAWSVWRATVACHVWGSQPHTPRALDVGGMGSPFCTILQQWSGVQADLCDPSVNMPVEAYAATQPAGSYDVVFSISTIEHVPEPEPFLAALAHVVAPGGLLFLTTDYWDGTGRDTAHFHWMRERIYTAESWAAISTQLQHSGFVLLTPADPTYYGVQLYGSYTFVSLALVKEFRTWY